MLTGIGNWENSMRIMEEQCYQNLLRFYFKKCTALAEPVHSLMVVRLCLQDASARKHLGIVQTSNDPPYRNAKKNGSVALQYTQCLHR